MSLSYAGAPAIRWRQQALRGDDTSLNADLRANLEQMLPGGMEIRVVKVDDLSDSGKPLVVHYEVKGAIGSSTGKRLLLPANLFESNTKPKFPATRPELAIDMLFPSFVQDAVRFRFPKAFSIESAPPPDQARFQDAAAFNTSAVIVPDAITLHRNVTIGRVMYGPSDYSDLRSFFGKLEVKDAETVILTHSASSQAGGTL